MHLDYESESKVIEEHTCIWSGMVVKCPYTSLQPLRCFGKSMHLKCGHQMIQQDCNWGFLILFTRRPYAEKLLENKKQIKGLMVLQWDLRGKASPDSLQHGTVSSKLPSPVSRSLRPCKQTCYATDLFHNSIFFPCNFCGQISLDNAHSLADLSHVLAMCHSAGGRGGENILVRTFW